MDVGEFLELAGFVLVIIVAIVGFCFIALLYLAVTYVVLFTLAELVAKRLGVDTTLAFWILVAWFIMTLYLTRVIAGGGKKEEEKSERT